MALIEIEFLKSAFEGIVGLVAKAGRAVPFPSLEPLGDDRLILFFEWKGDPVIDADFPGFTPPKGTILLRSSVVLRHASLAEIRLKHDTLGTSVNGNAWLLATATPAQVVLTLVGFDDGTGPLPLAYPQPLSALPLPTPTKEVGILASALVGDNSAVTLRLATSALDNPLQPPAARLTALRADPDATAANWLIHVPSDFFVDLFLQNLVLGLSQLPNDVTIEESPRASWSQEGGAWGVSLNVGVEKIDACPGLFGSVDISVDVTISARFVENTLDNGIDIDVTVETNASDWDSFRCFLGSAGAASFGLSLFNPYIGIVGAIASISYIGEKVRDAAGKNLPSMEGFTEVSRTSNAVRYKRFFPIDPIRVSPLDPSNSYALGPTGLDILGTAIPIPPSHEGWFNPNSGPLVGGAWTAKINCSERSMDQGFAFQEVIVTDKLTVLGKDVGTAPVTIYLSSIAEPKGDCWIETSPAPHVQAPGMRPGDTGFAVFHTSAGLRAYTLGPVPPLPELLPDTQHLIDVYCDSFRVPVLAVEIQELRWVEPPPNYDWGYAPLRQWQVVLQGLAQDAGIEVRANASDGPTIAKRADFAGTRRRAVIEIVTDANTNLVLLAPNAGPSANFTLTTRWLLPRHRETFDAPVDAISKTGSMLALHTAAGERLFDLDQQRITALPRRAIRGSTATRRRVIERQGPGLSLKGNQVALIHRGDLVIATQINTLLRADIKQVGALPLVSKRPVERTGSGQAQPGPAQDSLETQHEIGDYRTWRPKSK